MSNWWTSWTFVLVDEDEGLDRRKVAIEQALSDFTDDKSDCDEAHWFNSENTIHTQ